MLRDVELSAILITAQPYSLVPLEGKEAPSQEALSFAKTKASSPWAPLASLAPHLETQFYMTWGPGWGEGWSWREGRRGLAPLLGSHSSMLRISGTAYGESPL